MRLKRATPFSSISPTRLRALAPTPYKAFPVDKARPSQSQEDDGGEVEPEPEPICGEGTVAQCEQTIPSSSSGIAVGQFNVGALPGFESYPAFTYVRFRVAYDYSGVTDGVDTGTATYVGTPTSVEAFINESEFIDPDPENEEPITPDSIDITPASGPSCVPTQPTVTVYFNGVAFELNHDEGDAVKAEVLVVGCATEGEVGPPM